MNQIYNKQDDTTHQRAELPKTVGEIEKKTSKDE